MSNFNNTIDEIKSRANIVDIIGEVVSLKKAGNNYKGVCPFHNEKTPSFVVSEHKQIFTCFGCGASGDVIEFVQKYYHLEFMEAVMWLGEKYGIEVEKPSRSKDDREQLYEINREAAAYYYKLLRAGKNKGIDYAISRNLSPETLKTFGIGYADDNWTGLYDYLTVKGYKKEQLIKLGLVSESRGKTYDKFRNRLMFPIQNTRGKIIGFGGRIIGEGEPKYLNSPETPVFQKKNNIYGLYQTKEIISKENQIILVEGYMDVVSLFQSGVKNVGASLGTALTENQAKLIKRYTKNVVLSYDSDNAGINATLRGLDILYGEQLKVKAMHVTDGKDPDDYVKTFGRDSYMELVDKALNYPEYRINNCKGKHDINTAEGKLNFLKDVASILSKTSPVEADMYSKMVAEKYNISPSALMMEMEQQKNNKGQRKSLHKEEDLIAISLIEKNIIKILLIDENYMQQSADVIPIFISDAGYRIFQAMKNIYDDKKEIRIDDVLDLLSDEDRRLLVDINDNINMAGKEKQVFEDSVRKIKRSRLKAKEQTLLDRLSLADETINSKEIEQLTQELMQVQDDIRQA